MLKERGQVRHQRRKMAFLVCFVTWILLLCCPSKVQTFSVGTKPLDLHRKAPKGSSQVFRGYAQSSRAKLVHVSMLDKNLFSSGPLIAASDQWGNWALLTGAAAVAQRLGTSTAIGRLLGPPVTAMALTFCMASVGVLAPGGTAAAKSLQLLSLQLATPFILLGADLRNAGKRSGPLLISFLVASLATLIASIVAWVLTGKMLSTALGAHDGLVIASALLAKNIGGGINYIAVCRSLDASATAVAAGLCVDNIFALLYFPITSALASRHRDVIDDDGLNGDNQALPNDSNMAANGSTSMEQEGVSSITVERVSNVLFIAAVLLWLGERLGGPAGALPLTTLFTLLVASLMPRTQLITFQPASNCLGMVCLYLFFATAGSPGVAVADSVRAAVVPLGLFLTYLYALHGGILAVLHRLLGHRLAAFKPQRLLVSSSAAIGGPATAVTLAEQAGWKSLSVPSLLVGNVGYAIATFVGITYFSAFR